MHQFQPENNPFDAGQAMFRMWSDFMTKMAAAPSSISAASTPPDAAREVRSAILNAWSEYWQQFMRSKEFLETLKQSTDSAVQTRKQFNEWLGQFQHEFQGVSRQDIDQLMRMMRHVEQRSVDGLERVVDQLERVADRLEALEKRLSKPNKQSGNRQQNDE
jgi:hypothetical protein